MPDLWGSPVCSKPWGSSSGLGSPSRTNPGCALTPAAPLAPPRRPLAQPPGAGGQPSPDPHPAPHHPLPAPRPHSEAGPGSPGPVGWGGRSPPAPPEAAALAKSKHDPGTDKQRRRQQGAAGPRSDPAAPALSPPRAPQSPPGPPAPSPLTPGHGGTAAAPRRRAGNPASRSSPRRPPPRSSRGASPRRHTSSCGRARLAPRTGHGPAHTGHPNTHQASSQHTAGTPNTHQEWAGTR